MTTTSIPIGEVTGKVTLVNHYGIHICPTIKGSWLRTRLYGWGLVCWYVARYLPGTWWRWARVHNYKKCIAQHCHLIKIDLRFLPADAA